MSRFGSFCRKHARSFSTRVPVKFHISPAPMIPDSPMCNLYSQTKSQDAMRHVFDDMLIGDETLEDLTSNPPAQTDISPDCAPPILGRGSQGGAQGRPILIRYVLVKGRTGETREAHAVRFGGPKLLIFP
jgi:hypothetical protein